MLNARGDLIQEECICEAGIKKEKVEYLLIIHILPHAKNFPPGI